MPPLPSFSPAAVPAGCRRYGAASGSGPLLLLPCLGFLQTEVQPHWSAGDRAETKHPQQGLQGLGLPPAAAFPLGEKGAPF